MDARYSRFFDINYFMMDLDKLEIELKKRHPYSYQWKRKQNNLWDGYTNFIYKTDNWESLIHQIKEVHLRENLDKQEIFQYAANRWYNFHSAKAVEFIIEQMQNVIPAKEKDREKDFYIQGIPFDHKTSVFPKNYPKSLDEAKSNKLDLIRWFYENQSIEKRYHLKNRLFLVVFEVNREHWKLKAELKLIKTALKIYFDNFDPDRLHSINFGTEKALSDIIWVTR